jgi:uncharacterized protein (TIGR02452 family)
MGDDSRAMVPPGTSYKDKRGKTHYAVEPEAWYALGEADRASMAMEFQNLVLPRILKARPEVQEAASRSLKFRFEDLGSDEGMDIDDCVPAHADRGTDTWIFVLPIDCLDAAQMAHEFQPDEKVAVLNTANGENPGGRFERGSALEEDSLCIRTTLIEHLKQDSAQYPLGRNEVVLSPGVLVLSAVPTLLLPPAHLFNIDVISCAPVVNPPIMWRDNKASYQNEKHLELMVEKITGILRVAATGYATLVMGAFGCGAYKNPTEVVAEQMKLVLTRINWRAKGIKRVVTAIDDRSPRQPVWTKFAKVFDGAPGVVVDHDGTGTQAIRRACMA